MILESRQSQPLRVVQNWFREVERLAGEGGTHDGRSHSPDAPDEVYN